ncbi:MAG: hypothetical protein ACE5KM_05980 [Planctomycetaceae bacterium]
MTAPTPMAAPAVLDREFLEIRAKILQLAASFDRLDRGDDSVAGDPRMALIEDALQVLQQPAGDRAERIQMIFSRDYDATWRNTYGV